MIPTIWYLGSLVRGLKRFKKLHKNNEFLHGKEYDKVKDKQESEKKDLPNMSQTANFFNF